MARRGRKNSNKSKYLVVLLIVISIFAYKFNNSLDFDIQSIVDNSILKQKTFETNVEEVYTSDKKVKAYLYKDTTNPIISISFIFKNAGLASDNNQEEGIANLFASSLTQGAGEYDSLSFAENLENNGISLDYSVDMDSIYGSLQTTTLHKDKAFELLKSTLYSPEFAVDEIERLKAKMILAIKRQKENPSSELALSFNKEIFQGHPYARNPVGIENSIKSINKDKLQVFIKDHFTLNNLIIGVAGDISKEELSVALDNIFGSLPLNGKINFVRDADIKFDGRVKNINRDSKQNISFSALPSVKRSDADFYPLYIANYVFGGSGLNSKIAKSVRESKGLTYSISSNLNLRDKSSLLIIGFSTTDKNYKQVWSILNNELDLFSDGGITQKELDDAKNYLISSYNLRFDSISSIATQLALMQKENLGQDFLQKRNSYVKSVKLDDVNRVAKKYFDKSSIVSVNIGKFD